MGGGYSGFGIGWSGGNEGTCGALESVVGGKDGDSGFATIRLTEEGRARASDTENGDAGDEGGQEQRARSGAMGLRKD